MIVIHHNPDCGTSRNTLEMIKASGENPVVIEYLVTGWTKGHLLSLFAAANLTPKSALRVSGTDAETLGLTKPDVSDDMLLEAMVEHPVLVNRPIVVSPKGTKLCRPSELVLDLLETPISTFQKEDGSRV